MAETEVTNGQFSIFDPEYDMRYLPEGGKDHIVPGEGYKVSSALIHFGASWSFPSASTNASVMCPVASSSVFR